MRTLLALACGPMLALALNGCAVPDGHGDHSAHMVAPAEGKPGGPATMMGGAMAVASVGPTQGQSVRGIVVFHDHEGQVMVHARLSGLAPLSEHGFHVHEKGDCASADGGSAGGHFNPSGKPHGAPDGDHHAGDMPSLKADVQGVVDARFVLQGVAVGEGANGLLGRGVIVHAQADDYRTQPTGNSGARIACGVIAGMPH